MAEVKVVRHWRKPPPGKAELTAPARRGTARVVAIGASAGGPPVLAEILSLLPADLSCPVLVVQHISPGFAQGLVDWLGRSSSLAVKLAEADEQARPGTVYVAADGAHLGLGDGRIRLSAEPEVDGFRPSATHLLRSVAHAAGRGALGVVLTGMGRDGAAGLLELRRAGGLTVAQDEETSVIFGMPGQAIRLGAAEHVLPPHEIAAIIRSTTAPQFADNRSR